MDGVDVVSRKTNAADRTRNLIALDAGSVMRRLALRREAMIVNFSRHRDRQALLSAVRSMFNEMRFEELVHLEPVVQTAVTHFYELLDDLRFYFTYTQDMPGTAEAQLRVQLTELGAAYQVLAPLIGAPIGVNGEVVVDAEARAADLVAEPLLKAGKKKKKKAATRKKKAKKKRTASARSK